VAGVMIGIDPRKASRWVARYYDLHRLRTQAMCRGPRGGGASCSTGNGKGPGGQPGNDTVSSVAGSHPDRPALRNSHSRAKANSKTTAGKQPMLTSSPAPARRPTSRSARRRATSSDAAPHHRA
jgi:hypothetical protein